MRSKKGDSGLTAVLQDQTHAEKCPHSNPSVFFCSRSSKIRLGGVSEGLPRPVIHLDPRNDKLMLSHSLFYYYFPIQKFYTNLFFPMSTQM